MLVLWIKATHSKGLPRKDSEAFSAEAKAGIFGGYDLIYFDFFGYSACSVSANPESGNYAASAGDS